MRLNLNVVNAHLLYELQRTGAIDRVCVNGFDVILVDLPTGEKVAIHLVERDIDVGLIRQILTRNAQQDTYTLFILWCAMLLPEHGELYFPYDWMSALLALYGDKIYAFESEGANVWIFPVHFDPVSGRVERQIRYGDAVDMPNLACEGIRTESAYLTGNWKIADFDPRHSAAKDDTGRAQFTQEDHASRATSSGRIAMRVYFEVLGVALDADFETIRRAYRQLAMQYHPDLNSAPDATEKMQQINIAYARLAEWMGES